MRTSPAPNTDILKELTNAELLDLVQIYKSKGDKYHSMSIYNQYRWNLEIERTGKGNDEHLTPMKKTFYTHRSGNFPQNGTYISLQWDELLSIQFHTFEESLEELKECISKTKIIDWKNKFLLTAIHSNITDEIVELIETLGVVVDYEIPCTCFTLSRSAALEFHIPSVPEGYVLSPLSLKHADIAYENWPHNDEASVDFIRGMVNFNITLGIFRQKDNRLVAWVFQNEFYGVGILQVIPEEQRKGFGKLLTLAMSKEIARQDKNIDIVTAFAVVDNIKSESLVLKVGFERDCVTKWIRFKSK